MTDASASEPPPEPPLPWRVGSSLVMGLTGLLSRTFLLAANRVHCHGLEEFVALLDQRKDIEARTQGLITVSNHLSVLDDPLVWGVLPYRLHWQPDVNRWSLGSQDLMFKRSALCTFFSLGQCLPTHRLAHSPYGGLFQPTMTQSVRLLSTQRNDVPPPDSALSHIIDDPFSDPSSEYTSSPLDPYRYPRPSYYASRKYAWVHVFPEGRIHQHPQLMMRYFKWGVSRLILESDPAPALVPMWIEGFENVMHESRTFPRFLPRVGNDISVSFGSLVNTGEGVFAELRDRWRRLVEKERHQAAREVAKGHVMSAEQLCNERLKYGSEAVRLREECTFKVREEVLKVRRARGRADEDPKARLVDTWREEGQTGQREGKMEDGSWVKDT